MVGDLKALGDDLGEQVRRDVLLRLRERIGATDLWSFVRADDDLFMRDCIGAVPDAGEIVEGTGVEGPDGERSKRTNHHRRVVVHGREDGAKVVLVAAFAEGNVFAAPLAAEIFDCLAAALIAEETDEDAPASAAAKLEAKLEGLTRNLVRQALSSAQGNRERAAALLGIALEDLDQIDSTAQSP